jgi:glutaredoxin
MDSMRANNSRYSITLISKRGCHLCEQALRILESLKTEHSFDLSVLFIEDDSSLFDKYWIKVPVVRLNGSDVYEAQDLAYPGECKAKLEKLLLLAGKEKKA